MKYASILRILPILLSIVAWMSRRLIKRDCMIWVAKAVLTWRVCRRCQRPQKAHRISYLDKVEKYLLVDSLKISLRVNSSHTFKLSARSTSRWSYSTSSVGNREVSVSWPTQTHRPWRDSCGIRTLSSSGASGLTARWPPHVARRARKKRRKGRRKWKFLMVRS